MSDKTDQATQHRNDMYGNIDSRSEDDPNVSALIPAATVVLVRQGDTGIEVLMLRKNSKITFGGMWVFPGGKIDVADYPGGVADEANIDAAARAAAVRETQEEAGITVDAQDYVFLSHWTPPPGQQKRFATWFFVAKVEGAMDIAIDDGEIKDHAWLNPEEALRKHAAGEIDLVPPTWVTLYHLSLKPSVDAVIEYFSENTGITYNTRVVPAASGERVAMWKGDAGYDEWNPDTTGERHRLAMPEGGFIFENTVEQY
ncbi:MAG: NUDIX hydrolase [Pseudomonadales bacterium]|nr:NUDIX hydrolase [Pseudomonadales bacterium]